MMHNTGYNTMITILFGDTKVSVLKSGMKGIS